MEAWQINSANIGVTTRCNLSCRHCFVSEKKDSRADRLSANDWRGILRDLNELGCFSLVYSFGESILDPGFYEVAEMARDMGFFQILMTNGKITVSHKDRLKKTGIKKLFFSLDSLDEEKHNYNRRDKDIYRNVVAAIKCFAGDPDFIAGISFAYNRENAGEMREVVEFAAANGVKEVSFMLERPNSDRPTDIVDFSEREFLEMLGVYADNAARVNINFHDPRLLRFARPGAFKNAMHGDRFIAMNSCKRFSGIITIAPNGDVYPCNFSKSPLGNLKESGLKRLIDSAERVQGAESADVCRAGEPL